MTKKIIIINIEKSYIELDWILPVLNKLTDKFEIVTLFNKKQELFNLKKNKYLFDAWQKVSNRYFFLNKLDKTLIFLFQVFEKFVHKKNFIKKFLFHPKNIFFFKKINYKDIIIFLSDFNSYSTLSKLFQLQSLRPKIIRFPNSAYVFSNPKKNINVNYSLTGDLLLLNYELDINYWKLRIKSEKIKVVGTPKFQKEWLSKTINYSNENKFKNYILVTYSSRFNIGYDDTLLKNQLIDLMDILINYKDQKIVIKIHPRKNDKEYLKILDNYDKNHWVVTENHISELLYNSNIYLHDRNSSTLIEGLALNKRCIEYWDPVKKLDQADEFINDKLKINVRAENKKQLSELVDIALYDENNHMWISQRENYLKIINKDQDPIINSVMAIEELVN